jgi:hypothetical protein
VDCVEDYTAAPILDGGEPISSFKPTVHSLPRCHLGTIDGRPVDVGSGSILPAPIPALGELGPAFNQRLDDSDRRERSRSAATEDLINTRRSRPWEDDRRAPSRSLSRARTHRRSRSAESKDRRRSHARMESRCDDRQLRKRHHREDDDDEDRREPRRESSRRSSSRSLRAKSAGHHRGRERDAPTGMGPTVLQAVATATDVTSSKNMVPQPSPWFGRSSPPSSHATRMARIGLPPSRSCHRLLPGGSRVWPRPPSSAAAAVPPQLLDG